MKRESKYYSLNIEEARKMENCYIVIGTRGEGKRRYENEIKIRKEKQNENA